MAKKQRAGSSYKTQYSNYKSSSKHSKNKIAKLERHVKKYPEDIQSITYLASIKKNGVLYKRNKFGHNKGTNGQPFIFPLNNPNLIMLGNTKIVY